MPDQKSNRPTIGLLAGWQMYEGTILHSFLGPVLHGVRSAAHERDCNLLLACGMWQPITTEQGSVRPAWPAPAPDVDFVPVGPWNTDGLLVVTPLLIDERQQYVQGSAASGHPVVYVGGGGGTPEVSPVHAMADGLRQAVNHLVGHGHRRIALINDETDKTWGVAFAPALAEAGLALDPRLICNARLNRSGGRQATQRLLASGVPFTALVARNDELAAGAMEALGEAGLRVPGDVAVIGFDDRVEAAALDPPLTTVRMPMFEMGYQALHLLVERIAGRAEKRDVVHLPCRLIVRESCGCLPDDVPAPGAAQETAPRGEAVSLSKPGDAAAHVAHQMAEAVGRALRHMDAGDILPLCARLVDAFAASLDQDEKGIEFRRAFQQVLRRVEEAGEEPHAWHAAISVLEERAAGILGPERRAAAGRQVEALMRRARVAISASVGRQYSRHVVAQRRRSDQLGVLTAHLLDAQDEVRILETLRDHLPGTGIQRADVVFFEAEGDDPVAWSVLPAGPGPRQAAPRFPSREFPPPEMRPQDEPFNLALLPLVIRQEQEGFVAFDAADLESCAFVVRQLAVALHSARSYRQAVEGRQLAEEANRLKSRFLSMVSHELRTPLALITGLSEMLLDHQLQDGSPLSKEHHQDVERIYASARHLDSLVRDVLDLSRGEIGELRLVCEHLDLAEVLAPAVEAGEQLARDAGLRWRCQIPAGLPPVFGDRTRLHQVMLNLVSNAVKFTREGEVALEVGVRESSESGIRESGFGLGASPESRVPSHESQTQKHVPQMPGPVSETEPHESREPYALRFTDHAAAPVITISVSDTGLGIPPSEQIAIFDEFRQGTHTTARGYGGMGLGLAISHRLVRMHGGQLWVESSGKKGRGSTFTFTLPVLEREKKGKGEKGEEKRGGVVLVLAEQAADAEPLAAHLAERGFDVKSLLTIERDDWIEEILADLPGALALGFRPGSERGWEVMRALKENPATQAVPVLLYSLEEERDSGAVIEMDYLTKPVGTAELARALERQGLREAESGTILVVDDEPGVLEMHARVAEARLPGCRVLRARDGREALEVIRREGPDLVLLDLVMPEMDGFQVLEAMQEDEATRGVPVIVLTGQALNGEDMDRLNRGVAAVLGKGLFSVDETLAHVEQILAGREELGSDVQRAVRRAMAYVHEHHAEGITRETLARRAGVSVRHLARCFRQETGVTPLEYLNRYRIRRARALLEAGEATVSEVALAVGFTSAAHFSKMFRRQVGVSPGAYRKGKRE